MKTKATKKFVTLFLNCRNRLLIKDVGQIPFWLGQSGAFDTELVCDHMDFEGEYVHKEVKSLKIKCLKPIFHNYKLGAFRYILKNARKIHWLNLYHYRRITLYLIKLYRLCNPKGCVWLKLDMDFVSCKEIETSRKNQKIFYRCCKSADLVSVESQAVKDRLKIYTDTELRVIPDGFYIQRDSLPNQEPRLKIKREEKENVFLTVGRLGIRQKATENLLEAFAQYSTKQNDWTLRLVGSIEKEFEPYIEQYFLQHPDLTDHVIFTGQISDRDKLALEYQCARVFVLPSRWESFGIAVLEAMYAGCYVILTDAIPPAKQFTNDEKYGKIVAADDIEALATAMESAANIDAPMQEISDYAVQYFDWKEICKKISELLQSFG